MCPIYIEAVTQFSEGPQDLKESQPPALECSQEREWSISSTELWHYSPEVGLGGMYEEDLSTRWPAAESADHAGFELMYRSRYDETGEGWHCYNFDIFAVCEKS